MLLQFALFCLFQAYAEPPQGYIVTPAPVRPQGLPVLDKDFFEEKPKPPPEEGGRPKAQNDSTQEQRERWNTACDKNGDPKARKACYFKEKEAELSRVRATVGKERRRPNAAEDLEGEVKQNDVQEED